MSKLNLITSTDTKLSMTERGVLATLINDPECDYVTVNELSSVFPKDSFNCIHSALDELVRKGYVLELRKKHEVLYAVNKIKIPQMKVI
ncbi:MAG: hypothetical protein LUI06_01830 [Ruminococcus sp.]|nr:hypothetical protein [Ruminococcus sp.]MCD7740930.1 hypothetical protein [Ruminococcus sp.]